MEYKPDIDIKQEKDVLEEDTNDNYLKFSYAVHVKVENDVIIEEWPVQYLLARHQERRGYEEIKEEKPNYCVLCGDFFSDCYSLLRHNLVHLSVPLKKCKIFMCEHCPHHYYRRKRDLRNHMIINHITQPDNDELPLTKQLYTCTLCDKTYTYSHWYSHKRDVHGELKLKCEKCDLTFKCKTYLRRHIMFVHKGVKRYPCNRKKIMIQCTKCPSILQSKYALTTHVRNCHSENTYKCNLCKSSLKCKSYLLTHMRRVHYDDGMVHQCEICGKGFKSPRYMRIHRKNSHYKSNKS